MDAQKSYENLKNHYRDLKLLGSIEALVSWDHRVMMPPAGDTHRAEQVGFLTREHHRRSTDPRVGDWLASAEQGGLSKNPGSSETANIREWGRSFRKTSKIPEKLAVEIAQAASVGHAAWAQARKDNDFKSFEPHLEKLVRLTRERADAVGFEKERYDALIDDFEPGLNTAQAEELLRPLREKTPVLVSRVQKSCNRPKTDFLCRKFPREAQERFSRFVAEKIGFSFASGRIDPTAHPFMTTIGPGDWRITTRYDEEYLNMALFGTIHETGHALYEMGLPQELFGQPVGDICSLGVHESQSRLWENLVGRSRAFWEYFFPFAQKEFSSLLDVSLDEFYEAINSVEPSPIRVEADEVTYNLHILLRFDLELALVRGEIEARDVPSRWNETFRKYLGFKPKNDSEGCLQDVHWSAGAFGYFPTYSLGNCYSAQWMEKAKEDLGDLDAQFKKGEFAPLLQWLRKNVHAMGGRYRSLELVQRVTGKPASADALLRHFERKYGELYEL